MTFAARFIGWVKSLVNQVQRSLRLRSAASGHLNRVFVNGSATQWSHSQWMKRGTIDAFDPIFVSSLIAGEGAYFHSDNTLVIANNGAVLLKSNAVFRDPTAHMHIVFISDMANATAALRFRVFINNVELTSWATDVRASYSSWIYWNRAAASQHYIGYANALGAYSDSYRSDIVHVDAAVLDPSAFGQADASGNWVPKEYAGAYGTTGFRLKFDDPTSLTTLMADSSGNGNNWTANNISLTAGATYDSMLDVPLGGGGNERGNYATLNPLDTHNATFSYANLRVNGGAANAGSVAATSLPASGKWYWECTVIAVGAETSLGVLQSSTACDTAGAGNQVIGTVSGAFGYHSNGSKYISGTTSAYGATFTSGDTIGVGFDADSAQITFYKNNAAQGTVTGLTSGPYKPAFEYRVAGGTNDLAINFGQRPFTYAPPAGFKALHTGNLPTPSGAAAEPNKHFAAVTWVGDSTARSISGMQFAPDLVWGKSRSSTDNHNLYDSVRGATKYLASNATAQEQTAVTGLTSFNSDGFSLGNGTALNGTGYQTVAWCWKAGGASVANNVGSIASQVSANVAGGFSIVTFTGSGANATIGHGLGVVPKLFLVKQRGASGDWFVYHASANTTPQSGAMFLNLATGFTSNSGYWGNVAPTSTTFAVGAAGGMNASGVTSVAYCFAEIPGYSKISSYTGNGSADGSFVYCGFRPRWLLVKRSSAAANWHIWDSVRNTFNPVGEELYPNLSNAGYTDTYLDITSTGFKIRNGATGEVNANGDTYIFMAIAEAPLKYALAR